MRRTIVGNLVGLTAFCAAITLGSATVASADEIPTIEWHGGEVAVLLGGSWGSGVLHYKGYDYNFGLSGLRLAGLGGSSVSGSAKVYNLTRPEDLNGVYAGPGIGLTVAGGGSVATVLNQNGVRLDVVSTSKGLNAWLGARGIRIDIPESTLASVAALQSAEKAAATAEDAAQRAEAASVRLEAATEKLDASVARAESQHATRARATAGVGAH
jgi:hypothetical protein